MSDCPNWVVTCCTYRIHRTVVPGVVDSDFRPGDPVWVESVL